MKIAAPNYTQVPNIFFDEIMNTLNEGEFRVMSLIMRQTFGWHKSEDWLSLKFISEKTNYDKRSICRILVRLMQKNLVTKRIEGKKGNQRCYYSLMTDPVPKEILNPDDGVETEEDMEFFKNAIPVTGESPPVFQKCYTSDRRVTGPVTGGSPTKETHTKEKKQQQAAAVLSKPSSNFYYECLSDIDIPLPDKIEISKKYSAELVKNAVSWATHPETKLSKGLSPAIKWACQNKPEVPKLRKDKNQENLDYAKKFDGLKNNIAEVSALAGAVEIVFTASQRAPIVIGYNENGFKEILDNSLRKCNLSLKNGEKKNTS